MNAEKWVVWLMAGAGIILISIYTSWLVALGVFLLIWANNIDRKQSNT